MQLLVGGAGVAAQRQGVLLAASARCHGGRPRWSGARLGRVASSLLTILGSSLTVLISTRGCHLGAPHMRKKASFSPPSTAHSRLLWPSGVAHVSEHTVPITVTNGPIVTYSTFSTVIFSKWLHSVLVPERLRGLTRNQLGSACAGSSPAEHVRTFCAEQDDTSLRKGRLLPAGGRVTIVTASSSGPPCASLEPFSPLSCPSCPHLYSL